MDIIQVSNCDLMGRKFNGHDLQLDLNRLGHNAYQLVLEKLGYEKTTVSLLNNNERFIRSILRSLEYQLSMANLLYPYGKVLAEHSLFKNSQIVHYHLIHNYFISIQDFEKLTRLKSSVWTIHDPWVVTGHCIHPIDCTGWKNGCLHCPKLKDSVFPMQVDKASHMWNIKKLTYNKMNVDIVVSSKFMEDYIINSPLTYKFKNIHKIPFGIDVEYFKNFNKEKAKKDFGICKDNFVLGFRADSNKIKGLKYIIEMLEKLDQSKRVTILTVGFEKLPKHIIEKYNVIELGWQNDMDILYKFYTASDIFLMPSLAESFGLMAIEAMASECAVIVFDNTVLKEITFAPECGIAVTYKDVDELTSAVKKLIKNPKECEWRGKKGRKLAEKFYSYKNYVKAHINLYEEILSRNKK